MRTRLITRIFAFSLMMLSSVAAFTQGNTRAAPEAGSSMSYLMNTFPKLTELYRNDLANMHTHYIFVVDVSGSMIKYDSIVTPAIKAFAMALPAGEQVSVIPFGSDAKENTPGLCCKIEGQSQKQVLVQALSSLYTNDSYSPEFRRNTDIAKAVAAINKTLLNNQEPQMNVIVMITDFINDLPGQGEVQITSGVLAELNKNFDNVTGDCYTRMVAMRLPLAGTKKGYCLDSLQSMVFCNTSTTKRLDVVDAITSPKVIAHWFNQLSRDIMTDKLKAVIQLDNMRSLKPELKTDIDIDGNTKASIRWTPNKLYKQIKIDSTYVDSQSDFVFDNNKEAWKVSEDTLIKDLKLGKLKHKGWGFWHYNEPLNIGLSLPTEYDDELQKLSIDKPIPNTSSQQEGWLFTFFLPLWLTALLALLLLLYIFAVIKAFLRNRTERFIGSVDIYDSRGRSVGDTIRVKVPVGRTLLIGSGGNSGCSVNNVPWSLKVARKTYSPFLFWKKPAFEWSAGSGFVKSQVGNHKRGLIGRYGQTKSNASIDCGTGIGDLTHSVTIRIKK